MKATFLIITIAIFFTSNYTTSQAQNPTTNQCLAHVRRAEQLANDDAFRAKTERIERFASEYTAKNRLETRGGQQITIPVVVHVVYRTDAENISDAQINSQIDALNRDFNKKNADLTRVPSEFVGYVADCGIRFQLATRTADAQPTNGIVRHKTDRLNWGGQDDIKRSARGGFNPWASGKYLNLYVANIGDGILGYAAFPGTAAEIDAVVIDYTAFGTVGTARAPFNVGRTCVHEVAHWLNLFHIWGDSDCGDDHCDDTPTQKAPHYGNITTPQYSNCNNKQTRDMCMNFMDYVNDDNMQMFTGQQKARMQATLNGARLSLQTSDGCVPMQTTNCKVAGLTVSDLKTTAATLVWIEISTVKTYSVQYKMTTTTDWTTTTTSGKTLVFNNLKAGVTYLARVKADCTATDWSEELTFTTKLALKGSDEFENNNTRELAADIKTNTTITALIGEPTDLDWYRITTTALQPNVKIALSNLPADLDLRVYDATGRLVKKSENRDLTDETLTIEASAPTTYFIQIYGYNGAFDSQKGYELTTTTSAKAFDVDNFWLTNRNTTVEEHGFQIYPNPAIYDATLQFDLQNDGDVTVRVFDQNGGLRLQKVQNLTKSNPSVYLDLNDFPLGTYIVTAEKDGARMVKKLFKVQ